MPLVRVDVQDHLANRRAAISEAIHGGLVEGWEMPADDLFQIFAVHPQGDLFYSRTHPDRDRTDIVFVQVLACTGCSPEVEQRGAAPVVDRFAFIGVERDDVLVAMSENGDGDRFAASEEA